MSGGRGGEGGRVGQKVLSKPSADSFAVGRRQKEAATCASEFPTISDYANGNQYSSNQGVNKNENYPPASTGLYTWG
jgi:hypothetical protein